MPSADTVDRTESIVRARADALFRQHQQQLYVRSDRMFAVLLAFEWLAGVAAALWISPHAWAGSTSSVHPHVWAAIVLAGLVDSLPIALAIWRPGHVLTRHAIAVAQVSTSAILIHLSGGRIETHFHIFGSLAFLAVYRDWRVLITASAVVAADHFWRGMFWPQSVFGVLTPAWWRWLEHVGWVVFEDIILIRFCIQGTNELRAIASHTARLEFANSLTERKVVERTEQLQESAAELGRARDAAEAGSRAKGEFLANMSHEIRTPMNGIIGMTELALETPLSNTQRQYLETVRSCSDALLTLINDILDFSKIEAGKLALESIPMDVRDVVGDALKTFGVRADQKQVELVARIANDVPRQILGDPGRLRQILVNLLGNALKFTERGEIVVDVRAEAVESGRSRLSIAVSDTGIGIPLDMQQTIFSEFEQADPSTTRIYGGTGLGLAIVSKLTELMGGTVSVESQVGVGSTFCVTATFDRPTTTPEPSIAIPRDWSGRRALIVDDNATNRAILHDLLRNWGFTPTQADGGASALQRLRAAVEQNAPFEIVLLDVQMPVLDGFMLAERIQADRSLSNSPLLMLSSSSGHNDIQRCRELKIAGCLQKPIKQADLLQALLEIDARTEGWKDDDRPAISASDDGDITEPRIRPLTILLAEDNPVNCRVAVAILEKRQHTVVIANDGAEAVQAAATQKFDLILMDVQMPNKDGLQATAEIRAREAAHDSHTPIVAMTAHAMQGDRERCLAAGMDDYLSKPIRVDALLAAIARLVETDPCGEASEPIAVQGKTVSETVRDLALGESSVGSQLDSHRADGEILDLESLLERVENDWQLLHELVGLCLDNSPALLSEIDSGIARSDASTVERAAHALKGSLQNVGAIRASRVAAELEELGRRGDLSAAAPVVDKMRCEFSCLVNVVTEHSLGAAP